VAYISLSAPFLYGVLLRPDTDRRTDLPHKAAGVYGIETEHMRLAHGRERVSCYPRSSNLMHTCMCIHGMFSVGITVPHHGQQTDRRGRNWDREEGRNGGTKEGEKIRNRGKGKDKGEGPLPETPNFVSTVRPWVCNCSPLCV